MTGSGADNPMRHAMNAATWDAAVDRLDGDLLQRWNWGEFKSRYGWSVQRVASSSGAIAQILFRRVGPVTIAYIPRGPAFSNVDVDDLELLHEIDAACASMRAISLIVEPTVPLPDAWRKHGIAFSPAESSIQSPRTAMVDLTQDDKTLLRHMRKDTRYNISYAQRHGTVVEHAEPSDDALDEFFSLLRESAVRGEFGIHDRQYYADFLDLFHDRATLLFARIDGVVTAGLIACRNIRSARSMYAGMRPADGSRGDAALLRFAAMQWAREHGCTRYDLGGLAPLDPASIEGRPRHPQAGAVASMRGVEKFKTGFGGEIVNFPPTMERLYRPYLVSIARRFQRWAPRHSD